jgi:drug/metabolite transporter (DMT)-like permease
MAADSISSRPSRFAIVAAFAAVYLIWGSTYLAIRFAIETLPPFTMAGVRFIIAGAVLYIWVVKHSDEKPSPPHWRSALIVGGLLLLGGNGGVVWAEQFVPSGLAALVIATVPLWMVLFEWLGPDHIRPSRLTLLGLVVGFAGVAVLVGGDDGFEAARIPWIPAFVLLFASASWAAGSLYSRRAALPRSPLLATSMEMLGGGALLVAAGILAGEGNDVALADVSLRSALSLAYLIVFGSIVAFSAYIWLLRVTTPARASTYAYVNPVVAVLLGWLLASEPLTPRIGLATVLVVAAVLAVITGRDPARSNNPADKETGARQSPAPSGTESDSGK